MPCILFNDSITGKFLRIINCIRQKKPDYHIKVTRLLLFCLLIAIVLYKNGAMTNATTDINFNRILSEGPEVSLNGSPTVSPTTAALCGSEPL